MLVSLWFYRGAYLCIFLYWMQRLGKSVIKPVLYFIRQKEPSKHIHRMHFLLLTTLWFPLNALFRIAIMCHFPLSYTQNHRCFSFQQLIAENVERILVLVKHVKTDSPETKSPVYVQNRCVARQLGEASPPPSLGSPPSLPPSGLGGKAALEEPSFLSLSPLAREDWLALKTASIWPLQITVSMSTSFIHIPR